MLYIKFNNDNGEDVGLLINGGQYFIKINDELFEVEFGSIECDPYGYKYCIFISDKKGMYMSVYNTIQNNNEYEIDINYNGQWLFDNDIIKMEYIKL